MVVNFWAAEKLLAAQQRIESIELGRSWKLQINKNETYTENIEHGFYSRTDLRLQYFTENIQIYMYIPSARHLPRNKLNKSVLKWQFHFNFGPPLVVPGGT